MTLIRTILIVGGGSSGWMTAALLSKRFPAINLTLLESSDVPTLGVGESTNGIMRHFQQQIGLDDEGAFMRACNATYKVAIRFENFNRNGGVYFHPFGKGETEKEDGLFKSGAERLFPNYHLAKEETRFSKDFFHAYQLDAGLYGHYLKEHCLRRGVRQLVDAAQKIRLGADGSIDGVETDKFGTLRADLFIDCSGFRSLLLGKALQEPYIKAAPHLINDRAIAARVPYSNRSAELKTFTNCTALSAGWVWEIPLWSRVGAGYVYASAFQSQASAEEEFRRFLGEKRAEGLEFYPIEMKTGRHRRAWVQNCVGIGISYGFLEPLESTGLSLTQLQILDLARAIASGGSSGIEVMLFNRRCADIFDHTRDFIMAHYVLTSRDDTPFWRHQKQEVDLPDSLLEVLTHLRARSLFPFKRDQNVFYQARNWNTILSGMGFFDQNAAVDFAFDLPATSNHAAFLAHQIYHVSSLGETWLEELATVLSSEKSGAIP